MDRYSDRQDEGGSEGGREGGREVKLIAFVSIYIIMGIKKGGAQCSSCATNLTSLTSNPPPFPFLGPFSYSLSPTSPFTLIHVFVLMCDRITRGGVRCSSVPLRARPHPPPPRRVCVACQVFSRGNRITQTSFAAYHPHAIDCTRTTVLHAWVIH